MHFGLFIEELRCGVDDATGFREHFEFVDGAEASGVGRGWLGDIHLDRDRCARSIAIRTKEHGDQRAATQPPA